VEDVKNFPEPSLGQIKKPPETPDEYPIHVNESLYAALRTHSPCTCIGPKTLAKRHLARLRLKGSYDIERGGFVQFDMLFSASPPPFSPWHVVHWQDMQLRVPRYLCYSTVALHPKTFS
jgi:hypothetical protein